MPRGLVYVAGSERRILSHPDSPPSQMILEIRIRKGGLSIQGPAFWAVPGSPHFYTMHGCGSLPSETDGNPHTPLPRRLAHFGPVAGGFDIAQDSPPQPPGAQGQLCQELTFTQPTGIVPGYSYRLGADDRYCLSGASHLDSAPCGFLQGRHCLSAQSFPEDVGPYGSGFTGTSAGSAPYATHSVLVKTEGSRGRLVSRTPPHNGDSGLCISPDPLEEPPLAKARRDSRHGAQKEGCHDRRFQQGLRSAVRGQTDLRSVVQGQIDPAHQLSRNASSMSGLSILPTGHTVTPCASTLRQQVHGVINKSPGHPRLEATLHAGEQTQSFLKLFSIFLSALFNLIVGQSMPGLPRKRPHCVLCQEKTLVESTQEVC